MGDREKLIELQEKWFSCDDCADLEKFAEFLIANGVVVQQWISTKDRLPYAEYGESDSVLTISESGIQEVLYFDGSCWCHPTGEVRESVFHITHWMPLPEPPE